MTTNDATEPGEAKANARLFRDFVASTPFKIVAGAIGTVLVTLLVTGWRQYMAEAASANPQVQAVVSDVGALKVQVGLLKETADRHTAQFDEAKTLQAEQAALQSKIFEAIKGVSKDVQALEVHIAQVDQKVNDLKDTQRR
jgi:hypothetical protein